MGKAEGNICTKFGDRLGKFMKKANISYSKIYHATQISENHIKRTVAGKVNIGILHLELYARLFGITDHEMLEYDAVIPTREVLQKNIRDYFASIGYKSSGSFKKLGPTYVVEEFIEELTVFPEPLEAGQIKNMCNEAKETYYKTNDVSRVLNKLAEEEIVIKIETGNAKKPKYNKRQE